MGVPLALTAPVLIIVAAESVIAPPVSVTELVSRLPAVVLILPLVLVMVMFLPGLVIFPVTIS